MQASHRHPALKLRPMKQGACLPDIVATADVAQEHVLGDPAVIRSIARADVDAGVQDGHPVLPTRMQLGHQRLCVQFWLFQAWSF